MRLFLKLFGPFPQWFCRCFDRILINGYLSFLTREGNVLYFIVRSMEQGPTFAIRHPQFPTQDPLPVLCPPTPR